MNFHRLLVVSLVFAGTSHPLPVCAQSPGAGLSESLQTRTAGAIDRGLNYLEGAQHSEGYWSSADYPGLSGLAVQAYLLAPGGRHRSDAPVRKGLDFIRKNARDDGGIYNKGLSNYNTAVSMTTLLHAGKRRDASMVEAARKYLIGGQKVDHATPANTGGFGYDPEGKRSRPDLDNTVFALEAMALYRKKNPGIERPGEKGLDWKAAIDFVSSCQNLSSSNEAEWVSDEPAQKGGFTYTPNGSRGNTNSYGTMTYSGLLSMVHAEVDADDERVKAAVEWLSRHYTLKENPGQGEQGLYYYYYVMAKALTAAGLDTLPIKGGKSVNWRDELARKLLELQKSDGSWASENGRWMENDPVLVTSYVVLALSILQTGG